MLHVCMWSLLTSKGPFPLKKLLVKMCLFYTSLVFPMDLAISLKEDTPIIQIRHFAWVREVGD